MYYHERKYRRQGLDMSALQTEILNVMYVGLYIYIFSSIGNGIYIYIYIYIYIEGPFLRPYVATTTFLGRTIQPLHTSGRQNVHPVTVATFGDQLFHFEPNPAITNLEQLQSNWMATIA